MKSCEFLKFIFSMTSNRILKAATRKTQAASWEIEPVLISGTLSPSEISKDGYRVRTPKREATTPYKLLLPTNLPVKNNKARSRNDNKINSTRYIAIGSGINPSALKKDPSEKAPQWYCSATPDPAI